MHSLCATFLINIFGKHSFCFTLTILWFSLIRSTSFYHRLKRFLSALLSFQMLSICLYYSNLFLFIFEKTTLDVGKNSLYLFKTMMCDDDIHDDDDGDDDDDDDESHVNIFCLCFS